MNKRENFIVVGTLLLAFVLFIPPASADFNASSNQDGLNWRIYATTPITLTNITGDSWVNWTWDAGSGRIPPSSWNVSINGTWHNDTTNAYHNQSGAHWINISVWGWNSTDGVLSELPADGQQEITNHAPSTPSLVLPLNESEINDATPLFNWTCSDADGDGLTYTLQIDNETGFSPPHTYENTTITQSNHTLAEADNLTDGVYSWRIRANDTYTDSGWATFYNFTLDTVQPTITAMARSPASVLVGDPVTITCIATDDVSGVANVTVQIKDAKDRVVNYTMTAGVNNTFSYQFNYTGKSGWYYIEWFRSYDEAGNLRENASSLSFSATPYSGGGGGGEVVPSPTPDVNATVTPSPTPPPREWIRRPEMPVTGVDAIIAVGWVVGAAFVMLMLAILWNYNKRQKREGEKDK